MFKDIKVLGVDNIRTYKPDPEKSFYNVYFELSLVPPSGWVQIFERDFPSTKNLAGRKAWIDGRHIVVKCNFNEIDKVLKDMKREVMEVNLKYKREFLQLNF